VVLDEVVVVHQLVVVVLLEVLSCSAVLGILQSEEVVAFHFLYPSVEAAGHLSAYPSGRVEEAYPEVHHALVVAGAFLHALVVHLVGKVAVCFGLIGLASSEVGLVRLMQQLD